MIEQLQLATLRLSEVSWILFRWFSEAILAILTKNLQEPEKQIVALANLVWNLLKLWTSFLENVRNYTRQ